MTQELNSAAFTMMDRLRSSLPGSCVVCGFGVRSATSLCPDCVLRLPRINTCCGICGIALAAASSIPTCGRCLLKPPPFSLCRGVFHYRPPVSKMLTQFKYHGEFASGRALAWQLAQSFNDYYRLATAMTGSEQLPQLLVPVPLHKKRMSERGFNQALLIGKVISDRTSVPLASRLLTRTRHTVAQTTLHASKRVANLSGAFRVTGKLSAQPVRHIAVIDDVVTTTATATAVTQALLSSGVERVDIWAVART